MIENLFQGKQIYASYANDQTFIRNDRKLNRTFVDMATLGLLGYGTGIFASLFFKNKVFIRNFGLGFGLGYGLSFNMKELVCSCN